MLSAVVQNSQPHHPRVVLYIRQHSTQQKKSTLQGLPEGKTQTKSTRMNHNAILAKHRSCLGKSVESRMQGRRRVGWVAPVPTDPAPFRESETMAVRHRQRRCVVWLVAIIYQLVMYISRIARNVQHGYRSNYGSTASSDFFVRG